MHVIDTRIGAGPGGGTIDEFQGAAYGAGFSLIFENTDRDGAGPFLHQHPYPETFVVHAGRALFTVGGEQLIGEAGLVLVVPELIPHKFQVSALSVTSRRTSTRATGSSPSGWKVRRLPSVAEQRSTTPVGDRFGIERCCHADHLTS